MCDASCRGRLRIHRRRQRWRGEEGVGGGRGGGGCEVWEGQSLLVSSATRIRVDDERSSRYGTIKVVGKVGDRSRFG